MGWREEEGEEDKGEGEEQGTTMERQSRSCKIVIKKSMIMKLDLGVARNMSFNT